MASSLKRPSASTPAPSRVISVRRSRTSPIRPSFTSATRSRVEFVPMSTTAACISVHRLYLVWERPPIEAGQQIRDREFGHLLTSGPGGRADVRNHYQVRSLQQRIVAVRWLGLGH